MNKLLLTLRAERAVEQLARRVGFSDEELAKCSYHTGYSDALRAMRRVIRAKLPPDEELARLRRIAAPITRNV